MAVRFSPEQSPTERLSDGERTILAVKAAEGKRMRHKDPLRSKTLFRTRESKEGGEQLEPF